MTKIANNPIAGRPTESGSVLAGAIVALIIWLGKIKDPHVAAPLVIVVGAIPTGITWLVDLYLRVRKDEPKPRRRRRHRTRSAGGEVSP
ncbi:MAG TPA: hypothetical protein VN971_07295 [Thermoanaerobaculia bacterium]|nr:hypothetical protein [Thermoanaerobaculia bacterium]